LRDNLADPYTLGVQSGAALGAVIAICLGWRTVGAFPAVWLTGFAGAALTILVVVSIASEGRRMSSFTLLLTGVTINSICMAGILFLHYTAGFTQSFAIVRWLMGGIDSMEYSTLAILAVGIFGGLAVAMVKSNEFNLLAVGLGAVLLAGLRALYTVDPTDAAGTQAIAQVDMTSVVTALTLAFLATIAAGLYPAWRIGRIPPASYLKAQ
jgi:iron complex transport system permease protein